MQYIQYLSTEKKKEKKEEKRREEKEERKAESHQTVPTSHSIEFPV